jgi:hypothetical protein
VKRALLLLCSLALIFVAIWLWRTTRPLDRASITSTAGAMLRPGQPASVAPPPVGNSKSAAGTAGLGATTAHSPLADELNSPRSDVRADLRIVSEIIDTFRSNFPRNGNPVGNNADITAALTGKNSLRLALIPPDHPAVNQDGELCDRWGTPFFFHAESANRMEIRSAGPDKKMWTNDDVTFAP